VARQTLVLARNITEANRYAKHIGLQRFTYRPVRNAGSIRGVRNAEVHMLTSFNRRLDRHNILAALRWAKLDVFYVDYDAEQDRILAGPTSRELEVAHRYNALRDDSNGENMVAEGAPADLDDLLEDYDPTTGLVARGVMADPEEPADDEEPSAETPASESSEDAAPAEKPERRTRRRRCSTCGDLIEPDEMAAHEAEHAAAPAASADDFWG